MSGYSNYTTYSSTEQSYSTGEYSSGSGTSGGGFIKSEEGSSFSKGSQGNDRRNNNLRPVTIKQLHEATLVNDNSALIDGLELRVVKIVGVVKEKTPRHQGIDYVVDDGTGFIDVKVWHDGSEETNINKKIDIAVNTYAKFFGHYRVFSTKKHVAAHVVHPIKDHNEISYHMAEVIYAHLYLTKALNNPSANNQLTSTSSSYEYQSRRSSSGHVNNEQQLHKDIFDLINKQNNTQMGADVNEIAQKLAFQYGSDQAVKFAIEDMIGTGQLYVTSDDNHVKTTGY